MSTCVPAGLDVTADQWQLIRDILREHLPDCEVRAFGSRTTGHAKPYSDLDLALMPETTLPLAVIAALREAFSDSALPWKVDLVDGTAVSAGFRGIIDRHHIVVQAQAL